MNLADNNDTPPTGCAGLGGVEWTSDEGISEMTPYRPHSCAFIVLRVRARAQHGESGEGSVAVDGLALVDVSSSDCLEHVLM